MSRRRAPRSRWSSGFALLLGSIPAAVALTSCTPTTCGDGTHAVRGQDGARECLADPAADSPAAVDTNGDTAVDPGAPSSSEYPLGDCTRVKLGRDAGGGEVLLDVRVYDKKGYILSRALSSYGTADFTDYWWYDWSHQHTQVSLTEEWGGDHDADFVYRYEYRTDGQVDTEERAYLVDGEESWHWYATFVYDHGFLSEVDWDSGDGVVVSIETATWDGLAMTVQWDYELDGVIDTAWTTTYDGLEADGLPHGQVVAFTSDHPFDGQVDYTEAFAYDDEGHVVVDTETSYEGGVVSTSTRTEYALDEWGRYASGTVRYDEVHAASDYDLAYTYTCW